MKQLTYILLFSIFHFIGQSQSVNYKIDVDDPEYSNLMIGVEAFYIDMSRLNFPIGAGITAQYVGKPFTVSLIVNRALFDFNKYTLNALPTLKPQNSFELGIGLPYSSRIKNKEVRVNLSSSSSGGYTTTTYLNVPARIKRVSSLRGGLYHYRTSYDNEPFGDIVIDSVNMVASVQDYQPGVNQWEAFLSNVTVNGIYAGLSLTSIKNVQISSESDFRGIRSNSGFSMVYIDAIFAPFVNVGSYLHAPNPGDAWNLLTPGLYDLNDSYKKNRFGMRLGWTFNSGFAGWKNQRIGLYSRMEGGIRPSIKGGGLYGLLTVGIGFNGKIGKGATE